MVSLDGCPLQSGPPALVPLSNTRLTLPINPSLPLQGQVVKAVVVETKKEVQRRDGSVIKFDKNSCVLVNAKGLPIGTRVLGFVTHELRARQLMKVLSLAARVF